MMSIKNTIPIYIGLGALISISLFGCDREKTQKQKNSDEATLTVVENEVIIDGRRASVFNIMQPDGTVGLIYDGAIGDKFDMSVKNNALSEYSIHLHGVILPNEQDGVPFVTQLPDQPGEIQRWEFQLTQSGSYWMHSHLGLQIGRLFAAPLVIKDRQHPYDDYEDVILFLQDFSFDHGGDIDELFVNRKTLDDPEVVSVEPDQTVRLRAFNGSTNSNFYLDLGELKGKAIATDGQYIEPLEESVFLLAVAQRLDILITLPKGEGAYPIMAKREKDKVQTGLILTTENAELPKLLVQTEPQPEFDYSQEFDFKPSNPLEEVQIMRTLRYSLGRDEAKDTWTMNNEVWPQIDPKMIEAGDRVKIILTNNTDESHPMHLHGHTFQVTNIDGKEIEGTMRDTVLVLPNTSVEIQFDADRSGLWMFHCHKLMHQAKGMMTTINYLGYPVPDYYSDLISESDFKNKD